MADLASLGIQVTTTGVRDGAQQLDQLTKSAGAAENAAEQLAPAVGKVGAAARSITPATQSASAALRESAKQMGANGLSAGQYAQAIRLLPAQITDVVTSLASGSPAYLVAIQQGGQLRDSFGGFGNTMKALATIITPARLAIGGLAAGTVLALKAFMDGQSEGFEFAKAIALTGNAAGTTSGQLREYAQNIDKVIGTQANAAEVLAKLTATGKVANGQLESVALAVIRLHTVAGVSMDDAVKMFTALGDKPTEAAAKLTQQYNFLSIAQVRQIRELEESGRVADAAAFAQTSLSKAVDERTKTIGASVGQLQRMATETKSFFAEMWDAIIGGRQGTAAERLAELQQNIQYAEAALNKSGLLDNINGANDRRRSNIERDKAEVSVLQDQLSGFSEMQGRGEAERLAFVRQMADAEADLFRKRNEEKAKTAAEAKQLRQAQFGIDLGAIKRGLDAELGVYDRQGELLEAMHSAGLKSDKEYYAERRQHIEDDTRAQIAALDAQNDRLRAEQVTGVEALRRDDQIRANLAEKVRLTAEETAEIRKLDIARDASSKRATLAYEDEIAAGQRYIETLEQQYAREVASKGLGRRQQEFDSGLSRIQDRQAEQMRVLQRDKARATNPEEVNKAGERLRAAEEINKQEIALYRKHWNEMTALQGDWKIGALSALRDYMDAARDVASQAEGAFTRAFSGMEDALVKFALTGKLNFKDLANSIIADLIRIQLKAQLSNVFGLAAGALGFGGISPDKALQMSLQPIGARAGGGPVDANKPYLVGEKGPELIVPRSNGMVIPNGQVGSGAVTVNVYGAPSAPETRTRRNSQGGLDIDVIFKALEGRLAASAALGGPVAAAMKSRFNLREGIG